MLLVTHNSHMLKHPHNQTSFLWWPLGVSCGCNRHESWKLWSHECGMLQPVINMSQLPSAQNAVRWLRAGEQRFTEVLYRP